MPIKPTDLTDYAYSLYKEGESSNSEVLLRTSINRAYYGAFLAARDKAKISSSSGSVHQEVANHYLKARKGLVGNNLNNLKRLRHKADYEPNTTISIKNAKDSCRTALAILENL